jgi:endonuclease/exonuclease/phosphatase family metal-dependent hydrolase
MGESFRLVSANLRNADPGALKDLVSRLKADLAAVQELGPQQAAALAQVLPFGHLQPTPHARGMGIALRKDGNATYVPLPFRGGWSAEVVFAGVPPTPVDILNVHILAPTKLPPWRTLRIRRAQARAIVEYLDANPRRHRAVVGDLNSTTLWPTYQLLKRRFSDAAVMAASREGRRAPRTWRPFNRLPFLLRIDHVFTVGLVAQRVRVFPMPGSDHGVVVVDLTANG